MQLRNNHSFLRCLTKSIRQDNNGHITLTKNCTCGIATGIDNRRKHSTRCIVTSKTSQHIPLPIPTTGTQREEQHQRDQPCTCPQAASKHGNQPGACMPLPLTTTSTATGGTSGRSFWKLVLPPLLLFLPPLVGTVQCFGSKAKRSPGVLPRASPPPLSIS